MLARVNAAADVVLNRIVRGYFTKTSFVAHAITYPVLMWREGGDYHLFLDGISVEAVFVGLMVGISTKAIIEHHGGLRATLHDIAARLSAAGHHQQQDPPRDSG